MPSVMQEIRRKLPLLPKKELAAAELPQEPSHIGAVYQLPIEDIIPNRKIASIRMPFCVWPTPFAATASYSR